jgi:hypothetical protein
MNLFLILHTFLGMSVNLKSQLKSIVLLDQALWTLLNLLLVRAMS